jgi:hypothetical protein
VRPVSNSQTTFCDEPPADPSAPSLNHISFARMLDRISLNTNGHYAQRSLSQPSGLFNAERDRDCKFSEAVDKLHA